MILHTDVIAGIKGANGSLNSSRAIWFDVEGTDIVMRGKDRIASGNKQSEARSEKDKASAIPLLCWQDEEAKTRAFIIASFDTAADAELVAAQVIGFYDAAEPASRSPSFASIEGIENARTRLASYDERLAALNDDAKSIVTAIIPVFGIAPTAEQVSHGIGSYADHLADKSPKAKAVKVPQTMEQAQAMIAKLSAFVANQSAMKAIQDAAPAGAPDLQTQLAELLAKLNG